MLESYLIQNIDTRVRDVYSTHWLINFGGFMSLFVLDS